MSDLVDLDRGGKAKAVLDNPAFKEAFDLTRTRLIEGIEKCPTHDVETAEQFRLSLKLLNAVKSNLEVALKSGTLAQFRLVQDEQRKTNPLRNLFR